MRLSTFRSYRSWWNWSCCALLLPVLWSCAAPGASSPPGLAPALVRPAPLLPGQQIWKSGASSLLFGTNDTEEWTPHNIETSPSIQQALHDAGFTLLRSFFLDKASDAAVEARMRTIEHIGATCLGVITNIFNVAYDLHLVSYLGHRCQLYEFGNEPDYSSIPVATYLAQWNRLVPQLRQASPQARFIGPVLALNRPDYLAQFLEGVKFSGVLPDAISFHWYPCWHISEDSCLNQADTVASLVQETRALVWQILNRDLPIGVSEWNFDPGNPPASYGDEAPFITAFTQMALLSMLHSKTAFACQFDAASFSGYGHLDLFDLASNQPKPQYYALAHIIKHYKSGNAPG